MEIKLQNVLLPDIHTCDVAEMYFHENGMHTAYDGYFNLFYIKKRKAYTIAENLFLYLNSEGYRKITLYHDQSIVDICSMDPSVFKSYCFPLPYDAVSDGVFWFELEKDDTHEAHRISGYYFSRISDEQFRRINIGIDICTYRREAYLERNLCKLKQLMEKIDEDVSNHFLVYVTDNGRTLNQCQEIQSLADASHGRVRIMQNKNSGGAGGFTRGMLEILNEQTRFCLTHLLLMDDDAVIETDTLVRLYGFLSTLKDEWKDMTVGGAMLREDNPYMLYCAGEFWKNGKIYNPVGQMDLRNNANCVCENLTGTGHEYEWYSGWWCCCYSLQTVREDNLPLPLFIHHDDIEFGLRNRNKGIVFLNGIGVWHRGPELQFPGANLYYDVRNNLIEIALHQKRFPKAVAEKTVMKAFAAALFRMKYNDAVLTYRAITDFLRGPAWLYRQDPETLNSEIRSLSLPMCTLGELRKELTETEYRDVKHQIKKFFMEMSPQVYSEGNRRRKKNLLFYWLTLNGWILPAEKKSIQVMFSSQDPYTVFRKEKIVLCELGSQKVSLIKKDYRIFVKTLLLCGKAVCAMERGFYAAAGSYRANLSKITNSKSWREYLERK